MNRFFALRLGTRFARSTDRPALWRAGLIVVAAVLAVMSILTLLAIPGVMDQQGRRLAAQKPERQGDANYVPGSTPPLVAMYQEDDVDGRLMSRILVANPRPEAVLPDWLTKYPEPGEIVVSPEVAGQLADPDSAVARRFGHLTVIQEIADEGLVSPDQLTVVVGVTGAELAPFSPSAIPATGLGQPAEAYPGPAPNAIRMIVVAGAVFMIIPALVLTATAARLSARTRQRRLAVFRLIGLSARHTAAINAIETAAVTLVGAIVGVLAWNALVPVSEPIGLGRLRWFAEDVTVPFWVQAGLVGVLVVLAVVVSSTGSVPALIDPLAERRSVPKPIAGRRLIRLAPLILGALLLIGAAIYPTPTNTWFAAFAAGNALAAIGLFTAIPVLAAQIGGRLAGHSSAAPVRLAGRRLAHDPHAVARVTSGLLGVVLVAGFGQILSIALDWAASTNISASDEPDYFLVRNAAVRPAEGNPAVIDALPIVQIGPAPDSIPVLVATCSELEAVPTGTVEGCDDTLPQPLSGGDRIDIGNGLGEPMNFTYRDAIGIDNLAASMRAAPADLPPDAPAPTSWIVGTQSGQSPQVVDDIIAANPAARFSGLPSLERGRLISTYATLILAGTIVAILMNLLATLSALIDRTLERRSTANQLLAVGLPGRTLRTAEAIWASAPLAAGMVLAVALTLTAGTAYLRLNETSDLPIGGLAFVFGLGIVGVIAAAVAAAFATPTRLADRITSDVR